MSSLQGKQAIKKLYNYRYFYLLFLIFGFGLTFFSNVFFPDIYKITQEIYIVRDSEINPSSDNFKYDGYYKELSESLDTDAMLGFLNSKSIFYKSIKTENKSEDEIFQQISRARLKVRKISPVLLEVSLFASDRSKGLQDLDKIISSAILEFNSQTGSTVSRVKTMSKEGIVTTFPLSRQSRIYIIPLAFLLISLILTTFKDIFFKP